ncbi:MAG: SHOCT domain-containing protein [Halodesulfurarchaeum sp.]
MSSSTKIDVTTGILLIIGAIIVLPVLVMVFGGMMGYAGMMGYSGMMGGYGTTGGWFPIFGGLVPLLFLVVLVGGGYLLLRGGTETDSAEDPAMEELRLAYARGDLSDEEFENRRETLKRSK